MLSVKKCDSRIDEGMSDGLPAMIISEALVSSNIEIN
jgi:hypothetical protein